MIEIRQIFKIFIIKYIVQVVGVNSFTTTTTFVLTLGYQLYGASKFNGNNFKQ